MVNVIAAELLTIFPAETSSARALKGGLKNNKDNNVIYLTMLQEYFIFKERTRARDGF